MEVHEYFMAKALELAKKAYQIGEVPVGCVIIRDGKIIGQGYNRRESQKNALLHAEIEAINEACTNAGSWRLSGCAIYVTLEPCPMCAGAIINARIGQVFFGSRDKNFGACGGVLNLFEENFHHKPAIIGGILETECTGLIKDFFANIRKSEG
ncbi:MAG: nucleoside deaminase [Clostridiales bacterium]|nr:nucleoside deaminase [Clostridiales bacterium]